LRIFLKILRGGGGGLDAINIPKKSKWTSY